MPDPRPTRGRVVRGAVVVLLLAACAAALGPRSGATVRSPLTPGAPRATALGVADGAVPAGTTVLDDAVPGVARLDPALRAALQRAAADAARDGLELLVDSGWRSPAYQRHLLDEAVREHGSRAAAARWVAPPGRSAHVSGDAVDIGPAAAAAWLGARGAAYGLCRVYANEPWHFERRALVAGRCPATYADPTEDPRLHP